MRICPSVLLLSVFLLPVCCCHPKEPKPAPEADYLLVDRQVTDFTKSISPDGTESSSFTVSCDASWEFSLQEDTPWISIGEKVPSGKNIWTLPYTVSSNESIYPRSAAVLFKAGEHSVQVTLEQGVPDPLSLNKVPGFYGVDGVNVLPTGTRQSSSFRCADWWTYRIIDPSTLTVYALGGIPWNLKSGETITVSYKVVRSGIEEAYDPSLGVEVVRVTGTLVWLRKDESEYFILER
ncbi:MAG: BACON domain-containing protein [Bacteroidales bacterium]|nr:BACON domain-containing protein [Bacteroidales bacterium]